MSSDVHKANRPNNAQKRAKTGRNEEMSAGSPSENAMDSASKAVGQKILENAQQPGQPQRNDNTLVREWNNAKPIEKTGSYFPFRILDPTWVKSAADMPTWGMPHAHRDTLPRLCNRKSLGVEVFPRADRQGFVDAEGYWRLLIVGLNRQAAVSAMFMPQSSDGESPEHGVFLSALATGRLSSAHPTEMLLNCASEELKDRRTVFVLDVYCHGQGEVEVVINRAY